MGGPIVPVTPLGLKECIRVLTLVFSLIKYLNKKTKNVHDLVGNSLYHSLKFPNQSNSLVNKKSAY